MEKEGGGGGNPILFIFLKVTALFAIPILLLGHLKDQLVTVSYVSDKTFHRETFPRAEKYFSALPAERGKARGFLKPGVPG